MKKLLGLAYIITAVFVLFLVLMVIRSYWSEKAEAPSFEVETVGATIPVNPVERCYDEEGNLINCKG